jgi:hypothetical protein
VTAADERTDELLRPFLDAIDAAPDDPMPVAILADRLEEVGDGRAIGLRWLVENGKRPMRYAGSWAWFGWCNANCHRLPCPERVYIPHCAHTFHSASEGFLLAAPHVSTWLTGER